MSDDNVLVPRQERRINPPRRDADRIMALEIHQMYAAGQMKDLGVQFQIANKESEGREVVLWKRLDTLSDEIHTRMTTLITRVVDIDNRTATIQQYQQHRAAREWALVLGVMLAFATAIITMFVNGR